MAFGSPQDVEVLVDGAWVPGAMLGWRHDDTGACEAWVQLRSAVPGVVEGVGTWVGLVDVRLPERHLSLAPATAALPRPAGAPGTTAGRLRRSRRHGADATAEQPAVGAGAAGRHRAPSAAEAGRHRAVTTEMPAVAAVPGDAPGAAPGDAAPPDATVVAPAVRGPVAGGPAAGDPAAGVPEGSIPAAAPAAADVLTRPIRLGDLVPMARGGRPPVRPTV